MDEVSGEYIVLHENGVGRMDLWSFNDNDEYLGGVAFVEKDGGYYVAEITGLPANSGQQLAGQMASSVSLDHWKLLPDGRGWRGFGTASRNCRSNSANS